MKRLKKNVWGALNRVRLGGTVQLAVKSQLRENGWMRSFHTKRVVNKAGQPIPWCTYPFIKFMEPRLQPHFRVFEFGSGNATRWYAARVKRITAVEHDQEWLQIVQPQLPDNAQVIFQPLDAQNTYAKSVLATQTHYHLIIVDGRQRVACTECAWQYLTADGAIVFDNSDRLQYQPAYDLLAANGFRRLDFWGMAPIVADESCTSIFYWDHNCLGI